MHARRRHTSTGGLCLFLPEVGAQGSARLAGAYAAIRQQFGLSIGKFEGIHEPLARLGGFAYLSEAARRYTCGALDGGAKPAVITAMMKYNTTELSRRAMNDAMEGDDTTSRDNTKSQSSRRTVVSAPMK